MDTYRHVEAVQCDKGTFLRIGTTAVHVHAVLEPEHLEKPRIFLDCDSKDAWMSTVIENAIDMESLMVNKQVGWKLTIKLLEMENGGNLIDAYMLALMLQLHRVKKQHIDHKLELIHPDIRQPTRLQCLYDMLSVTICIIESQFIVDPTREEEELASGIYTFVLNEHEEVCFCMPTKPVKMDMDTFQAMLALAITRYKELRIYLRANLSK